MNILLLSTMYPNPLRPGTGVCHYFAREWVKMGHSVLVIHYRSMFPSIYRNMARIFPKLAYKYIGNHVEMDCNMDIVKHEVEGITVYSIPIFKYIPHGSYTKKEIQKKVIEIKSILENHKFIPDSIIGHFHNPQFQIIGELKAKFYPQAYTCVTLHELAMNSIKKCYGKNINKVLDSIDIIGFRSIPIKQRFEDMFGNYRKSLVCWSGTPQVYLSTPSNVKRQFTDKPLRKFLYVGQTIKRKFPRETVEAINRVYGSNKWFLNYVGSKDIAYDETQNYIRENHLEDKVAFLGKMSREKIIQVYDESECFILISKNEVFGLVYLEAMSRGCIVIASKNEGMEGIIHTGENGFLCTAGDVEELSEIINLINQLSAEEKQHISDNARRTAEELSDYNVAKMYLENIINKK